MLFVTVYIWLILHSATSQCGVYLGGYDTALARGKRPVADAKDNIIRASLDVLRQVSPFPVLLEATILLLRSGCIDYSCEARFLFASDVVPS